MPAAREPAARGGDQAAGRAVGRHEEARGDRAGDRGEAQVSAVRRADLGARSGERRRDRRVDRAAARRAGRDERGGVARRARLVPGGGPGGAVVAGEDPRGGDRGGDPRFARLGGAAVPRARPRNEPDPGRGEPGTTWSLATRKRWASGRSWWRASSA